MRYEQLLVVLCFLMVGSGGLGLLQANVRAFKRALPAELGCVGVGLAAFLAILALGIVIGHNAR